MHFNTLENAAKIRKCSYNIIYQYFTKFEMAFLSNRHNTISEEFFFSRHYEKHKLKKILNDHF